MIDWYVPRLIEVVLSQPDVFSWIMAADAVTSFFLNLGITLIGSLGDIWVSPISLPLFCYMPCKGLLSGAGLSPALEMFWRKLSGLFVFPALGCGLRWGQKKGMSVATDDTGAISTAGCGEGGGWADPRRWVSMWRWVIENICPDGNEQKQGPFEDCLWMMRWGHCLRNGNEGSRCWQADGFGAALAWNKAKVYVENSWVVKLPDSAEHLFPRLLPI